jgi:serine/threonine protein phosphatase PrpC
MLYYGNTDKGKKRESNQDSYAVFSLDSSIVVGVVCDGMGGANGGETASRIAAQTIENHIRKADLRSFTPRNIKSILQSSVYAANAKVFDKACNNESLYGMGTTAVIALVKDDTAYIVHAGDSRAYLFSGGELTQITRDHSIVQDLIERGQITSEEALIHPKRNVITRALGTKENIEVDYNEIIVEQGDTLLLCSDGLSNYADKNAISRVLSEADPSKYTDILIDVANLNGGGDNITAVIITDFDSSARRDS